MLGHWEFFLIAAIVIIILGPFLLPKLGRQIGQLFNSAKDFKDELVDETKSRESSPSDSNQDSNHSGQS